MAEVMHPAVGSKPRFLLAVFPVLIKRAFATLTHNDPLRMAGATAFFTSFALPFILILITQLLGLIIDPLQLRRELFADLSAVLGRESVRQVVDTLIAFRRLASNLWITVFGFLFLLMVATTLLMVVKGSINQIWRIKPSRGRSFFSKLGTRFQSVLIIVGTGVLIVISILAETIRAQMGQRLTELSPTLGLFVNSTLLHLFSLLFVTLWFGIIFRLLPDARPAWKVTLTGAFFTAILFTIGKYVLRLLLINSNIGTLYGTSASIVLVLLFVFYSSLILYFGAAFTKAWADYLHCPIKPLSYARRYKVTEVDEE
ncbi:MAG TPA: YihY/virulence factor BrkB family protein [Flavisolibacter sp.]|nr:YihY/virulence factor BrkB family protein [Flavisolibacter sp.]